MESLNIKLLEVCSKCGACYHICPSCLNLNEGYDPRAVIKDILAGQYEKWLSHKSIWQCLECHHCLEICFQHYGFENAMAAMRTLASKKGLAPTQVKRGWDMFIKTSRLGEPAAPARKKLGLPEAAKSGAEDFKKILKIYQERKESGVRSQKSE
ncbi:MAG: 4Fe-4S dicluster domain-containing protein [Deltaproteobacteria bacterium]|nr:4Fe-4S dicluster domain-containing protein [Deltaproteobacteria bacterium]